MKCRLGPTLLALLAGQAGADVLPVSHWTSLRQPAYLTVPATQTYRHVSLHLRLPAGLGTGKQVRALLNGKSVGTVTLNQQPRLMLPDLPAGISELRLERVVPDQGSGCAALEDVPLEAADLSFTPQQTGQPILADLPAGLYQPERPEVAVGAFQVDHWTEETLSAALSLVQVLSGPREVIWQSRADPTLPADFQVVLHQDAGLSRPVYLQLRPTRLEIRYRQPGDLALAVNSLASPTMRKTFTGSSAGLTSPVLLPTPEVRLPRTLAELGIQRYRVTGGQAVNQPLSLPPVWVARGPTRGTLHYRLPEVRTPPRVALRFGRQLNDVSPNSVKREVFSEFQGPPAASGGMDFSIQASGLGRCDHALEVLPDSSVFFQARIRSGLAGLPMLLARHPSIQLPRRPEAINLALNLAGSLRAWGLSDVLVWQSHFADQPLAGHSTLTLAQQPSLDQPEFRLTQSLWLRPLARLQFANPGQALALGRHWSRVPAQLDDHMMQVNLTEGGEVRPLPAAPAASPDIWRSGSLWVSGTLLLLALGQVALGQGWSSIRRRARR